MAHADPRPPVPDGETLPLAAYRLPGSDAEPPRPAPAAREWMRRIHGQFASRCLPLVMANQAGWIVPSPTSVRIVWDGGVGRRAISIESLGPDASEPPVASLFGRGIVTWTVPFLFRTPPGYDLLVRGPPNEPRDGIAPLEGLVETDWSAATFTMNWQVTRPAHPIEFRRGEAYCMIVPQPRRLLESVVPTLLRLEDEPDLAREWGEFQNRRNMMNQLRAVAGSLGGADAADRVPFEGDYAGGRLPSGAAAPEHRRRIALRPFSPGAP